MSCSCGECDTTRTDQQQGGSSASGSGVSSTVAGSRARLESRILAIRFVLASVFFTAGIVLSLQPQSNPIIDGTAREVIARALFILSWLVAGYRVVFSALRNISKGQVFDENFLMTVATVGAFIIGQWSEGAAVMLFFNLGEMVQESAVARSRRSIGDLMDVRPDMARLAADNCEVHPSAVPEGTLIRILPGEKVPLDGMITEGLSSFDTSRLTGESLPRDVFPGEEALAGFVNGAGLLLVRTTAVYAETAAAKMLNLIENAQNRKAKAEKLITSFARVYTPIVTIGALLLAIVPPLILLLTGHDASPTWSHFAPWISRALVFLVISCPCAFVISVPLGFFGGIGGAAKHGILVKGADYIDVLAKVKAVVFDKTGTLTRGLFEVSQIETTASYSERDVALISAVAEFHSNHPVGIAIKKYASKIGLSVNVDSISEYAEHAGYGVSLVYEGKRLIAGSRKHLNENQISGLPAVCALAGTCVEVASEGAYIGRLILSDEPKPDSKEAITELAALGIHDVLMITGDTEVAARSIADKIGITKIHSGVLPHEKVSIYEEFAQTVIARHPKGTVVFVGDGINDAPVLARADAGLAMGGMGSDAAIEAADVVLMTDSPLLVAKAISSARWTRHIVTENIVLAFVIKLGFLALGALGFANLWEAVFADVGVALLATLNSLRARR